MRPDTVRSAALIREARLRAGLSQHELAARSGKERTVIARWEQGTNAPSLDTLIDVLRACGFDVPLNLIAYHAEPDQRMAELQLLSPERRLDRFLGQNAPDR